MSLGGLDAPLDHDPANEQPGPTGTIDVGARDPIDTMPASTFSSSNVHSALYDFGQTELYVRYLRQGPDAIYQYWGVPPSTWDGLVNAGSKGSYINANIAYSFTYSKLSAADFPERGHGMSNDLARRFVTSP